MRRSLGRLALVALVGGAACQGRGKPAPPAVTADAAPAPVAADAAPAVPIDAAPARLPADAAPEPEKPMAPEVPTIVPEAPEHADPPK